VPLLDPFRSQADLESAPPLPPVTGYLEACAPTRLMDLDGCCGPDLSMRD